MASTAACPTLQDARYSIGWFVWPKDNVLIQGPGKKYPPTTMKEFMKVRAATLPACTCDEESRAVCGILHEASRFSTQGG